MKVYLIGIGMGNPDTLTLGAKRAIEVSDVLIGARRLLEPYAQRDCEKHELILSDEIAAVLDSSDAECASVLFSGDVGFYSGATKLAEHLADREGFEIEAIPGISSLVYFCAKLLTPWQDAHLVSAHGRACDPVAEVRAHAKTFFLTGGATKVRDVLKMLVDAGLGDARVAVGERLSYDDERIVSGTAVSLAAQDFDDLAVMLVEHGVAPRDPS